MPQEYGSVTPRAAAAATVASTALCPRLPGPACPPSRPRGRPWPRRRRSPSRSAAWVPPRGSTRGGLRDAKNGQDKEKRDDQTGGRTISRSICQPQTLNALHVLPLLHPAVTNRYQRCSTSPEGAQGRIMVRSWAQCNRSSDRTDQQRVSLWRHAVAGSRDARGAC